MHLFLYRSNINLKTGIPYYLFLSFTC